MVLISFQGFLFGQELQLTKDFIKDNNGELGLRAKYIKKEKWGTYGRYMFNGVPIEEFFTDKSRTEILELLGKPNEIINSENQDTDETDENGKSVNRGDVKIDKIVYFISKSDKDCNNSESQSLPSPISMSGDNNFDKGMAQSVSVEFYYNCTEKSYKKDRIEQVVELHFTFYLGDEN